jgi:parallel beta-helix repeat protein
VYNLGSNLLLGSAASGIIIQGYTSQNYPTLSTTLNRGNPNSGAYVVQLTGAVNVTLANLELTGGYDGIYAASGVGSTKLKVLNSVIFGNYQYGVDLESSNDQATFSNDVIYGIPDATYSTQNTGLYLYSAGDVVTNNTIYDTQSNGIYVPYSSNESITGNHIYGNGTGIYISNNTSLPGSTVSGNFLYDNRVGINVGGPVVVSGNTVYGELENVVGTGIELGSTTSQAVGNTLYNLQTGIYSSQGPVLDNQISNSVTGVEAVYGGPIQGNHIYGNGVGVLLSTYYVGTVSNNVLEGNGTGIHVATSYYGSPQLSNNTIDQETGTAIQVDSNTNNVHLLNNILWAQAGFDITVTADSEVGFQSDYNDLYTTGTGALGQWQGQTFTSLADWFYELGLDGHSLTVNPQFVNPAGADGLLGYSGATIGSATIIDDSSSSGFSVTGTWSTHTGSGYNGEYLTSTGTPGPGTATATWTFTGLTAGATYEIGVTWPGYNYQETGDAPFTVLDGSHVVGYQRFYQYYPPGIYTGTFTANSDLPDPGLLPAVGHDTDGGTLQQCQLEQPGRGRCRGLAANRGRSWQR